MTRVRVHVTPGARVERVLLGEDGLRVWVNAPPIDGRANRKVVEVLASRLGVAKSQVAVVLGAGSRHKTVEIDGIERDEIQRRLAASSDEH
ncbi:MAG TPA: DUF167 domain-containing protein [Chloroflexota bacterium]|jgi:hypothetical protein|nr:DUF167 domain-containing protein [Chloroflexota bacterium]